jgi:transketolase
VAALKEEIEALRERARRIRVHIIRMAGVSDTHAGGSLSLAELTAALYFRVLRWDPAQPRWEDRDRVVLSKGHCIPALYAAFAELGVLGQDEILKHLALDSRLPGHANIKTPGIDATTGSLGHGLAMGVGMALAARGDKRPCRTFVILGDGELQEGSCWEAAMAAGHYKLDRLVAIVDRNHYQAPGHVDTEGLMAVEPLAAKWESFGWAARNVNGHDLASIVGTLESVPFEGGKPSAIIADTVKGKGVSFLENAHAHYSRLNEEQTQAALRELGE